MLFYIPNLVDKTTCIGNSLSTFNGSFTALDSNLYNLSTYTVNSVNFLSSTMISVSSTLNNRIGFLSATMISVSSTLTTNINFVSSYINTDVTPRIDAISSELGNITDYISFYLFTDFYSPIPYSTTSDGQALSINFSPFPSGPERQNAQVRLKHNISIANLPYALNGLNGKISIFIETAGKSVTGFGSEWIFNGTSALKTTLSARNLIHYYVDEINNQKRILAELKTY